MEKFADLVYRRPDVGALSQSIRDYTAALAKAGTAREVHDLLFAHKAAMAEFATMQTVASIRNTADTRNEFYEEEMAFFHREVPRLSLLLREADEALLASPFRGALEEELGELYFRNLEAQKQFADPRIVDDLVEESRLSQLYSKTAATASTFFRGEERNFYGLLKFMQSTDRSTRREAFHDWAELYARIAPELDDIYSRQVRLRHGMARKLGFDSYTDMAYLRRRRYDYGPDDTASFRRQVREIITPACLELRRRQAQRLGVDALRYYDESLIYPEGNPVPRGGREELVAKARRMYREMSPETGEFFDCMVAHDLFDLETRPGKRPGGYCTALPAYKVPFIFSNFNGTSADVDVLTHEAGHAFAAYRAMRRKDLPSNLWTPTMDAAEVDSMSMEFLTAPWHGRFFGDALRKYELGHAEDALTFLPYGCMVDEFQHRVYEEPSLTPAQRNALWLDLEKKYRPWLDMDGLPFYARGAGWQRQLHIYLYPFYYIDYCMAQTVAFQFWTASLADRQDAWARYLRFVDGAGAKTFAELVQGAGLRLPYEPGCLHAVASSVAAWLRENAL